MRTTLSVRMKLEHGGRCGTLIEHVTPGDPLMYVDRLRQNDVNHDQTSSGVQVHGHVLEQLLGGVAHEL
jgi:hypothetical protein